MTYAERFLEFFTDIIVQLPTRRFFNVVLDDMRFVIRCFLSPFIKTIVKNEDESMEIDAMHSMMRKPQNGDEETQPTTKTGNLCHKMLSNFEFYSNFEINDTTGETLTQIELMEKHYEKALQLQKAIFKNFRTEMPTLPLQNIRTIDKREVLQEEFEQLSNEQLNAIGASLQPPIQSDNRELLMEILISEHERVQSHLEVCSTFDIRRR